MKILIRNGHVVDPANKLDGVCDLLLENSKIKKVAKNIRASGVKTIDAQDKIVMPGVVDMHVHLREPGREDKETVASATQAAAKGGVTSVLAMPNTTPPIDCIENVALLEKVIKQTARVNVLIAACITQGRRGERLTDIAKLKSGGVVAISDDGSSVDDEKVILEALKAAKKNKLLVICHSEDKSLSKEGIVNLGIISTRMGLRGISSESEYKRVQRDVELAEKTKTCVHIAHLSCRESVEVVARAKKRGVCVSAETAPHYFALTEEAVCGFDTNMKVNPPLRSRDDAERIKQGLKSGIIDAIASDHAPHTDNEKDIEFDRAEFGAIGLETELAVSITELVEKGILDWSSLVKKMATNPARILGVDKGTLSVGAPADIIVVSPHKEWLVEKKTFLSKSKNSAFLGRTLKGVVEHTICGGKIVYQAK